MRTDAGAGAARELYVYWKTASVAQALAAVRQAQDQLERDCTGLHARVLRREEPGASAATVMEIYTCAAGIDPKLQAAIDERLLEATQTLRSGPRHTEVFIGT